MKEFSDDDRLYLDDLKIVQRFTSGTHVVDEEQIKAFARQFDCQRRRQIMPAGDLKVYQSG
jgi:hypothetical protein